MFFFDKIKIMEEAIIEQKRHIMVTEQKLEKAEKTIETLQCTVSELFEVVTKHVATDDTTAKRITNLEKRIEEKKLNEEDTTPAKILDEWLNGKDE